MTETPPPPDYDFSGLPATKASSEDRPTSAAGRLIALVLLPLVGLVAVVLGAVMRAGADHDIASTAAAATTPAPTEECILAGDCAQATGETASLLVYIARDIGLAILTTGAVMVALGVALVAWSMARRPVDPADQA